MSKRGSRPGNATYHGGFIPGIEGMRSLAVLVVLLFHLDTPGFGGGYLGVDLFFVISGFIITRNILSDVHSGTFSLKEFYIRRFRRLFPALLATVLATLGFAVVVVPPVELVATAKSAVFALFSLANFHFWMESGYFDAASITKPLLHTWSLSVEEQFYLFWPALILLLADPRRRMLVALVLLSLSLAFALLWRDSHPDAVFYLLPFRLHQLMAGALIAILSLRLAGGWGNAGVLLATAGFVGLSALVDERYSPAVGAAAVTGVGALMLLARETALAGLLFANRLMQWIGQRSYAIYLVHWPIIVLLRFNSDHEMNNVLRVVLFSLSILAAMLLHKFVENPFRKRGVDRTLLQRKALPVMASMLAVTVVFAVVLWKLDGLPSRFDTRIQRIVESVEAEKKARQLATRFGNCNLHQVHSLAAYKVDECATVDPERRNVLIIGDSMGADTYMMLSQAWPEIHFSQATGGACTGILRISDIGGKYPTCEALNEFRFSTLIEKDMDLIVLASIWNEDRIGALKDTVDYLRSRGKNVLVFGPRAHFELAVPLLMSRESSLDVVNDRLGDFVLRDTELLQQIRAAIPDVEIIDIGSIQCTPRCDVVEGERLLYVDERHFTPLGAKRIGERLRSSFDLLGFLDGKPARKR